MPFLFFCSLLAQAFFSVNNQLPTWYFFQEVSINLGAYWLLAHLSTVALLLGFPNYFRVKFRVLWIAVLLGLSWQYVSPIIALSVREPLPASHTTGATVRILSVNVYIPNQRFADLKKIIAHYNPDIVGLIEADATWLAALQLEKDYPYRKEIPRDDAFGIALYSRFPFVGEMVTEVGENLPPVIHSSVRLSNGQDLELVYVHTLQPLIPESFHPNRALVRRLSTPLRHSDNPVLVFGDLNATWYSGLYKRFREAGRLKDAMAGFGVFRTWHAENFFMRLTLDHMLYRGMSVLNYERGPAFGSDHFPIIGDFSVPTPDGEKAQ